MNPKKLKKGCVHIYHGDGKGKTTCGIGLCIRGAGAGLKVLIAQFLKDNSSSERKILETIPGIYLAQGPSKVRFTFSMSPGELEETGRQYREMFREIVEAACAQEYDMVFLDEILHLIHKDMIPESQVLDFLDHRPEGMEVILTGYYPSSELLSRADYVSHIVKEKHPYDKGLTARLGIEM